MLSAASQDFHGTSASAWVPRSPFRANFRVADHTLAPDYAWSPSVWKLFGAFLSVAVVLRPTRKFGHLGEKRPNRGCARAVTKESCRSPASFLDD